MSKRGIGFKLLQGALALLVLGAAIASAVWLVKTKSEPQRQTPRKVELLVETTAAASGSHTITIEAMGPVISDQSVAITPEVSGLVVWKNPNLIAGGLVPEGEPLIRIDDRNYAVAVRQAEANLRQARVEYEIESARGAVAAEEWRMLGKDDPGDERHRNLALRKPQLQAAAAGLQAASNALARAELDMERTEIAAPFNALVLDEQVDLGRLVGPQSVIANLAGTDRFLVQAALPAHQLDYMQWPDQNGEGGATVTIEYDHGESRSASYTGRVVRVLGGLGEVGRLAKVLIGVADPLRLESGQTSDRLFIGAYVRCLIEGRQVSDTFRLPSELVREGNKLWIMDEQNQLEIRPIEPLWRQDGTTLVSKGLKDGERIVTSHIAVPMPGAELRELDAKKPRGKGEKRGGQQ